ncbi:MAG: phytanoyl-CoA dioxygenase family protein [Gammaproteobacteria bacterium]|nr:phytanoyl-CoA dioxygenase family protein [Gammaproteobacteria bacterium]
MITTRSPQSTLTTRSILTAQQKQSYQHDGYLVLKNFITEDLCEMLVEHARKLIENWDETGVRTIFSTLDQHHEKTLYFLESGDKIRFFFEEGAINEDGELKSNKLYSINKIGHALHDLDPIFNCFSRLHKTAVLCRDLEIIDPIIIQSMYICKQPFIGGEVTPHQDSTYLFVQDQPITGLWFALQDATIDNGCLWVIPGGHQIPLKTRMLRNKNNRIAYEVYDDTPWPMEKMIPLEVPRGSLVVLNGLLPHMSKENISPISRNAYSLHVMSKHSEYSADNWLQRPKDNPFRGFLG